MKENFEYGRIDAKLNYYGFYLLLNGKSPDIDFTLGEKLQLLTIPASDVWTFKINLAKTIAGLVLLLPRSIRDKIIAYGAKIFFNIKS